MINYDCEKYFCIEGPKDILEFLKNQNECISKILWHKKSINSNYFDDIKNLALERNIDLIQINNSEFKNLKKTIHSIGIFALLQKKNYNLKETIKKSKFIIILDNIQDPGNFGTIIRTGYNLGLDAILTLNNSVKLSNPKVLRATKGYFDKFPILENVNSTDLFSLLNESKFNIFALDSKGKNINNKDIHFEKPLALIFGSEGQGLSEYIDLNIKKIAIPVKTSNPNPLNLAICVGIMLFEVNKNGNK
jgi:TrmH family RNA methyltransferase